MAGLACDARSPDSVCGSVRFARFLTSPWPSFSSEGHALAVGCEPRFARGQSYGVAVWEKDSRGVLGSVWGEGCLGKENEGARRPWRTEGEEAGVSGSRP